MLHKRDPHAGLAGLDARSYAVIRCTDSLAALLSELSC